MTPEPLPKAVDAKYLTCALRGCGALGEGRVCDVVVESSRPTPLSRIMRLRLTYDGAVAGPASLILKIGLPNRAAELADLGRREVEFYTAIAGAMSARLVPRCFEAVWEGEAKTCHLLLEDLTDSHFVATKWPLPPTLEQCRRIVHALARFHAAWWDDSRLGVAIGRWLDADDMKTYLQRFAERYKAFTDRVGDRLSGERQDPARRPQCDRLCFCSSFSARARCDSAARSSAIRISSARTNISSLRSASARIRMTKRSTVSRSMEPPAPETTRTRYQNASR